MLGMGKIWQVKVFFGLIKSTLTCAHRILEKYSISWQIPKSEPVSQTPNEKIPGSITDHFQKTSSSLHPATSRFSWQVSGNNIICVPVDFEPAKPKSLFYSNENIAACIPEEIKSAKKTFELENKEIEQLANELFSTVINEFSLPTARSH
ncbi:hypothetical protein OXX80_007135 [Metschnikowia pulcherrima]